MPASNPTPGVAFDAMTTRLPKVISHLRPDSQTSRVLFTFHAGFRFKKTASHGALPWLGIRDSGGNSTGNSWGMGKGPRVALTRDKGGLVEVDELLGIRIIPMLLKVAKEKIAPAPRRLAFAAAGQSCAARP